MSPALIKLPIKPVFAYQLQMIGMLVGYAGAAAVSAPHGDAVQRGGGRARRPQVSGAPPVDNGRPGRYKREQTFAAEI
jgi:hypothetical protein